MKTSKILAIICAAVLFQGGCAQLPTNATPKERAEHSLKLAEQGLQFTVGPAITTWLLLEKDPQKQAHDAALVYSAASGVYSAATGKVFSREEIEKIVVSFTGSNDSRYIALAQLITTEYANIAPLFKIAESNPAQFLAKLATLAMNAAAPFLPPKPTP